MKFLSILSTLSLLATSVLAAPVPLPETVDLQARAPALPPGAKEGLHVWIRLDTTPEFYHAHPPVDHTGLNNLMQAIGGSHKDVVVGSPATGFEEMGLQLPSGWIRTNPSGDGAKSSAYTNAYTAIPGETLTYVGRLDLRSWNMEKVQAKGMPFFFFLSFFLLSLEVARYWCFADACLFLP
jgi:hypothetical protein